MKIPWLTALSLGLVLPGAQTHEIHARDATDVLDAISSVQARLSALDNAIVNFRATVTTALTFLTVYTVLNREISSATSTVTSTGLLSNADSGAIILALGNLTEKVTQTQDNSITQEPVVREAGYAGTVCAVLDQLNSSTDAFFGAIVSTIDAAYTDQVLSFRATATGGFAAAEGVWCA